MAMAVARSQLGEGERGGEGVVAPLVASPFVLVHPFTDLCVVLTFAVAVFTFTNAGCGCLNGSFHTYEWLFAHVLMVTPSKLPFAHAQTAVLTRGGRRTKYMSTQMWLFVPISSFRQSLVSAECAVT